MGTSGHVGDIDINASSILTLNAGSSNTTNSALAGILFYRVGFTNEVGGPVEVHINGGARTVLSGGFYFLLADATYNGNSGSSCTVIVGGAVTMNGDATLTQAGCANLGTTVPHVQSIRMVE